MTIQLLAAAGATGAEQIGYYVGVVMASVIMIGSPFVCVWSMIKLCKSRRKTYLLPLILSGIPTAFLIIAMGWGMFEGFKIEQTYIDEDFDAVTKSDLPIGETPLRISIPDHWDVLKNLNELASFQAGNPRREEYCLVFAFNKLDISADAETLYYNGLNEFEVTLRNAHVIDEQTFTRLGKESRQARVSGSVDEINLIYLDTVIEGRDHYYRILQWTLPSKSERALPVFQEVIDSLAESGGM
jgi:hypothetical protein